MAITPVQLVWSASSGLYVIPRNAESTAKPFTPVEVTGGTITYACNSISPGPVVSGDEQEWASLLKAERKSLSRRRVKRGVVNKSIRELRYRR
jgi:hypothetical protein